jgi:hypothetical protein
MEPSKEEAYADYFYELFEGHLSVAEEVDPLLAHVAMRGLVDGGINKVLDTWSKEAREGGLDDE